MFYTVDLDGIQKFHFYVIQGAIGMFWYCVKSDKISQYIYVNWMTQLIFSQRKH